MRYDRTIIGYHGCSAEACEELLGGAPFRESNNAYDWLGRGVYFWEWGVDRAWRWAQAEQAEGTFAQAAVVGAVVQLGRCFDLMDTRFTHDLASFFPEWSRMHSEILQRPLPRNLGDPPDFGGRYLDCAVLNAYLDLLEGQGVFYDTVRCAFSEGAPVFDGAGIMLESHIQIAVRNPDCVVGVFRPTPRSNP